MNNFKKLKKKASGGGTSTRATDQVQLKLIKSSARDNLGALAHSLLGAGMVLITAILVIYDLELIAVLIFLLSKWRTIAVQPRYWVANLRSNIPDVAVGLSVIHHMSLASDLQSNPYAYLTGWALLFLVWQLLIKPRSTALAVSLQSMLAQALGLSTLLYYYSAATFGELILIAATWMLSISCARHFINYYDEPLGRLLSLSWALFVVQLTLIMNRWLTVIDAVPSFIVPTVVIIVATSQYCVGSLFNHYKYETLKNAHLRQFTIFTAAIMLMVIVFTNWTGDI